MTKESACHKVIQQSAYGFGEQLAKAERMTYRKTTKEELALVLEEKEGYTIKFKQNVNSDLPKGLVAFANASGGRIFIGVNDHSKIVGCSFANKTFSQIHTMFSLVFLRPTYITTRDSKETREKTRKKTREKILSQIQIDSKA